MLKSNFEILNFESNQKTLIKMKKIIALFMVTIVAFSCKEEKKEEKKVGT